MERMEKTHVGSGRCGDGRQFYSQLIYSKHLKIFVLKFI